MKRWIGLFAACVLSAVSVATAGTYDANWDSLDSRPTPSWWIDAKFGIFIHWGVYAVPAWSVRGEYSEWYWNRITGDKAKNGPWWQYHAKTYGEDFPYAEFAQRFKAELYDPNQWADVFLRSGAKYVVLTSKHHDGYCMWPSQEANRDWGRPWNSVDIGPGRDLLGELTTAVRAKGLRMGIYYSLYEWYNPVWLADRALFVRKHMFPQFKDVVTRYGPEVIFSDGEWDMPSKDWHSEELLAWLFNESPVKDSVVVNDRWGGDCRHKHGGYFTTEYGAGLASGQHPWEENRGMGYSYGYSRTEPLEDYRSARELILMLIDIVSRRQSAARHRPGVRRDHPGHYGGAVDPDRRLAQGQRRGHLRHSQLEANDPVDRGQAAGGRLRQGVQGQVRHQRADGPAHPREGGY